MEILLNLVMDKAKSPPSFVDCRQRDVIECLPVARFTLFSTGQRLVTGALVHSHGWNTMFC